MTTPNTNDAAETGIETEKAEVLSTEESLSLDAGASDLEVPAVEELEIDDKMLSRVDKMQSAFAAGEIDDRLLAKAAKAIGISEEEARRRLSSRLAPKSRTTADRPDRKKRSKQAKDSRKRNRG